jgi:hypothetical protein
MCGGPEGVAFYVPGTSQIQGRPSSPAVCHWELWSRLTIRQTPVLRHRLTSWVLLSRANSTTERSFPRGALRRERHCLIGRRATTVADQGFTFGRRATRASARSLKQQLHSHAGTSCPPIPNKDSYLQNSYLRLRFNLWPKTPRSAIFSLVLWN